MAKLNAAARKSLPTSSFALPSKAGTPQGKAKGGSYPIPDASHARNALARSSGKPVAGQVRAAVARKFPGLGKSPGLSSYVNKTKYGAKAISKMTPKSY